jgi:hypothetical protein
MGIKFYAGLPNPDGSPAFVCQYPEVFQPWLVGMLQDASLFCEGDAAENERRMSVLLSSLVTQQVMGADMNNVIVPATIMRQANGQICSVTVASGIFGMRTQVLPEQNGSYVQFKMTLTPGVWDCYIGIYRAGNTPILGLRKDGTLLYSYDTYLNPSQYSARYDAVSFPLTIANTSTSVYRITIEGKNPSSTGRVLYVCGFTASLRDE